ncbi:hypothetical protein [Polaromonas eurypsychrophila]|uniref:Uncharacterized protein n=1 Tax=Polaromonas eurypsychrophila TaxID=1614635 RepID=A0A916SIN8_9BURK|nr:hypothetical protein [Polaromonas eurypsychrophila]GGA99458.1 hypothetical protein GCM10011496_20680 [Polaromonas eurypsychrophila]
MQLHRSEKAKLELASRARVLNVRERGALFLADGLKTRDQMQGLLQDDGRILQKLIVDGYLIVLGAESAGMTPVKKPALARQASYAPPLPSPSLPVAAAIPAPAPAPAPGPQGDNFEGKRSLATTRMFLFDICERMFVRKMPELAKHYRDQLREARDRESMMAIARDIILNVEEVAGPERADGLSERIAMLLPPEH